MKINYVIGMGTDSAGVDSSRLLISFRVDPLESTRNRLVVVHDCRQLTTIIVYKISYIFSEFTNRVDLVADILTNYRFLLVLHN